MGLRLRKSPSLLDLIQMKLSQGAVSTAKTKDDNLDSGVKRESQGAAASGSVEKLKASNFPATFLRIGSWEVYSSFCMPFVFLGNIFFHEFISGQNSLLCSINQNMRVT